MSNKKNEVEITKVDGSTPEDIGLLHTCNKWNLVIEEDYVVFYLT